MGNLRKGFLVDTGKPPKRRQTSKGNDVPGRETQPECVPSTELNEAADEDL